MCLDVSDSSFKAKITLYGCHNGGGNQLWHYDHVQFQFLPIIYLECNQYLTMFQKKMKLVQGNNHRCMEHDISTRKVYVTKCKQNNDDQKWIVENYNSQSSTWSLIY